MWSVNIITMVVQNVTHAVESFYHDKEINNTAVCFAYTKNVSHTFLLV